MTIKLKEDVHPDSRAIINFVYNKGVQSMKWDS